MIEQETATAVPTGSPKRRGKRNANLMLGLGLLAGFVLIAIAMPLLSSADPQAMLTSQRLKPPSWDHWFGTDRLGRDVAIRVAFSTADSLAVGVIVALLACSVGTLLGLVAGYFRWTDGLIMRVMDGIMAVPGIMIAIAMISVVGASITTVVLAIAIHDVPRVVRLVRGAMLSLREEAYVEAAALLGSPPWSIVFRHMLPGILAPLAVVGTYIAANAMLLEATLSFLGCGLPPDVPTWGNIMADGRSLFRIAPWIILWPGVVLAIAVLAINLLGDGLRDAFDPTTDGAMR
ncbi:ABC transporter permease [Rhodopseudomonas palustris]|nr:ABC transporter permease [Rhodopseudomonas palustris]